MHPWDRLASVWAVPEAYTDVVNVNWTRFDPKQPNMAVNTLRYAPRETIVIASWTMGDSPPQTGLGPEIIPFSGFLAREMAAAGVKVTLFIAKIRS